MAIITTNLRPTRESARQLRFEPTLGVVQTNTQKAIEQVAGHLLGLLFATDFAGVDPSGATDSTDGIISAITATPSGSTLFFPTGVYKIKGSGPAIFSYIKAITIEGNGVGSIFLIDPATPTTRDVFYIPVPASTTLIGGGFKNFQIASAGGSPAKNSIHIDTTASALSAYNDLTIDHVYTPVTTGPSIFLEGRVDGIGTYFSVISGGGHVGITILYGGDKLDVFGASVGGTGIISSQVAGAGRLNIQGNIIVPNAHEGIIIDSGIKPIMQNNILEHQPSASAPLTGSGMINIRGASNTVFNATIFNNQVQVPAGALGNPNTIYVGDASDTEIKTNRVAVWGSVANVVNSASAVRTFIGGDNVWLNENAIGNLNITDTGSATRYGPISNGTILSVVGNSSGSVVLPPKDIIASSVDAILRVQPDGGALGFGSINLAGVGAVGTSILPAVNGGTGKASYAVGDLLYADTTTTLARLADVAANNVLISGGVGVAFSWGKVGNAALTNSSLTINGVVISLGGSGTITAAATNVAVGTTTVTGGTTTRVLNDTAGVLGEYAVSGTGSVAMTTSPAFTTPNIGVATATSINGNTWTAGTGTLTLAAGKTLTANNSIVLAGTDGTTMTFPATSGAVLTADSAATLTNKVFNTAATGNTFQISGVTINAITGTGVAVLATSPTLVTPNLGTPSAVVLTNATGTAAGLTAGNVTTNANLTGPITSVGNATSIAAQTGTGTTFVMSVGPTLTGTTTVATLAATTINGFTLGGTIAGGGNQLNNIIIGTATPLAGTFTTLTGSTYVASPLLIGGSGTTGTQLILQTTSGNGTTDAIAFKGGNNGATTFATLQTGSFNIQSGSTYSINGTSVLSGTTLGSGVTASSLITFGTSPNINTATGTSLALGGGSIGTDALEITGTTTHNGAVSVVGGALSLSGNQSLAAWTTNGVKLKGVASTLTDTTSSGTVATAYTNVLGGNTIAASSAATFTNYFGLYLNDPVQGTNVTLTNKWALGVDSLRVGTSNQMTVSNSGVVSINNLTAATINAFTLGGTISGGGNALNNIVIGGTTPLAGTFTTLTGNTSTVSPIHAGGTGAASTLTLESTTGAGTTDAIAFQTASQVYRGGISTGGLWTIGPNVTPNAGALLTINANTVALPAPTFTNTVLQIGGSDSVAPRVSIDSFATNGTLAFRRSNGTAASPSQVLSGQTLGAFFFEGRDTAGYDTSDAPSVRGTSTENFTTTAHGTKLVISTIPNGSLLSSDAVTFNQSGGVGIGTTADPGVGTLILKKQAFAALTAASSTIEGAMASVTDSTTNVWGATITGGGANHVMAYCNGTNWTVAGK